MNGKIVKPKRVNGNGKSGIGARKTPMKSRINGNGKTAKSAVRIEALKKIELFSTMTSHELRDIEEKILFKHFKKNDVILREENTNEFMYAILDGEVKVVQTTGEGKEIIITVHRVGDFFGELSLIDGKTAPAAVYATKNSETAIISKQDFFSLLHENKILENLLRILCARLRESIKKIQILNFNNAGQRIKMLFLMLSESYGQDGAEGTTLNIKLTHQDIGEMTGLSRETVTRILDKWRKTGEIQLLNNKCLLLKPEFLSITL